jgi:hypothetical protein
MNQMAKMVRPFSLTETHQAKPRPRLFFFGFRISDGVYGIHCRDWLLVIG